jgi:DNA polymerase III delta subunit
MIVKGQALEQLLMRPGKAVRAVLFYGPNAGRVQEYAGRIVRSVVENVSDPFRIAHLTAADLNEDPARLADEAAALAMTGGRRVVRVRGAGDAHTEAFENCLDSSHGDSLIVVEAGELGKTSRLRKLFESSAACAIGACYEETNADLEALVIGHLRQYGLGITSEAKDYLLNCLGEDRLVTRQELEKLILYKGPQRTLSHTGHARANKDVFETVDVGDTKDISDIADGKDTMDAIGVPGGVDGVDGVDGGDTGDVREVACILGIGDTVGVLDTKATYDGVGGKDIYGVKDGNISADASDRLVGLADVMACIGDSSTQDVEGICDAMALADLAALDSQIQRAYDAAVSTISILRVASNHMLRIQMAIASMEKGESGDMALRNLRPPIHFSRAPLVQRQLRLWNRVRAARALDLLLDAEAACKTTGAPDLSLCRQALIQVALLVRRTG